MIKKIIGLLTVLLLLAIGGIIFYLDSLVQRGIEVAGSRVLGTAVTVDSVFLSPLSGSGSISGLRIANPDGFDSPYAFELGEVSMALDLASLSTDLVEVDSVIITSPRITYETTITNDNIRALMRNIETGGSGSQEETAAAPGKDIIIHDFQILSPQLDLVTAVASAPVQLRDIQLTGIGTGNNGVTARELTRMILSRINQAIIEGNIPGLEGLRNEARERLQEVEDEARSRVDDAVENLGNSLRDILN
ncbi:MAG: hypothetical protein MRY76_01405 [Pseudomonadales bacterium]|nr:hypothetical protein [Pseudomonadales bacterium]